MNKIKEIIKKFSKKNVPNILPGDTVKVFQKIKDGAKERIQVFEGTVLGKKHGSEVGATITVRKVSKGVAVERIFPIHSPLIEKIEVVKRSKVRRAKLYFLRTAKGKRGRLKRLDVNLGEINKVEEISEEEVEEKTEEVKGETTEETEKEIEEVKEDKKEEAGEEEIKEEKVKEEVKEEAIEEKIPTEKEI